MWENWLAEEDKNVERDAGEHTSRQIVATMRELAGEFYQLEGRLEDARQARRDASASITGGVEQIYEWADQLLRRSAWEAVLDLEACQPQLIENDSRLLYALAEANLRLKNDPALVDELADKALNAAQPTDENHHYLMAAYLREERGIFDWAEREYRLVTEHAPQDSVVRANTFLRLASMHHAEQQDEKASDILRAFLAEVEKSPKTREALTDGLGTTIDEVRALDHFYRATAAEANRDGAKQREELENALQADPAEADVLIAMYRLDDTNKKWREKARQLIRESSEHLQREISQLRRQEEVGERETAASARRSLLSALNNYAWLVSNTEGNFEEALRFSQQSLAMAPGDPGLLDTLARCYYSLGEFDQALKYQRWAAQTQPA